MTGVSSWIPAQLLIDADVRTGGDASVGGLQVVLPVLVVIRQLHAPADGVTVIFKGPQEASGKAWRAFVERGVGGLLREA